MKNVFKRRMTDFRDETGNESNQRMKKWVWTVVRDGIRTKDLLAQSKELDYHEVLVIRERVAFK